MSDADTYRKVMEEIKARVLVVVHFIKENKTTGSETTDIEFITLQFRKILELIALSSIAPNKEKYSEIRKKFESDWNAKYIIQELERVNPEFFPRPVVRSKSDKPGVDYHFEQSDGGYLTIKEFLRLYEKCNGLLHADNPFGNKKDYASIKQNAVVWVDKIQALLDLHCVLAYGHDKVWIVQMREGAGKEVVVYTAEGEIRLGNAT